MDTKKTRKNFKSIAVLFLTLVMWIASSFSVCAATNTEMGVEITVSTDKQEYQSKDKITATVTVKNTNDRAIENVSLECFAPEGYKAEGDSTYAVAKLDGNGQTATLPVTFVPAGSQSLPWGVIAIVAILVIAGVAALLVYRKKHTGPVSLCLCAALILSALPMTMLNASEANDSCSVSASAVVKAGGKETTIKATATFDVPAGDDAASSDSSDIVIPEPVQFSVPELSEPQGQVAEQRQQVKETMENAVNTVVQFKEIEEFNPDKTGYEHIKAITYDGLEYKGQKTKVFAYIGFPEGASADAKVPAVVLVHGGQGHPFLEWVRQWNDRGYAAIAMETTGYFPNAKHAGLNESDTSKFTYGLHGIFEEEGYVSAPTGTGYPANYKELEDQWPYHALAQIILAGNVLRQDERVDTDNIGITGVSWGGVMTTQVIGYDNRFSFAIPVYGSAYLGNEMRPFDNFESEYTNALWAAERNLDNATMPILWFSWNDDYYFSIPGTMISYLHTEEFNDKNSILLLGNWNHGHYATWSKQYSYLFADWVTYGKGGFITYDTHPSGRNISCTIDIPEGVTGDISAVLYYITEPMTYNRNDKHGKGSNFWCLDQPWQTNDTCLTVDSETGVISGVIPDEAMGYYIQLSYSIDGSKYEVSSLYVSVNAAAPGSSTTASGGNTSSGNTSSADAGSSSQDDTKEPAITIAIDAKSYTTSSGADPYIKDEGEAVQYWGGQNCYSTWTLDIEESASYTFTTIGTGMIYPNTEFTSVIGKLYINDELVDTIDMNTNEKYNPWVNPLESVFDAVKLEAGTYVIRLEIEGGTYIMDKMLIESVS